MKQFAAMLSACLLLFALPAGVAGADTPLPTPAPDTPIPEETAAIAEELTRNVSYARIDSGYTPSRLYDRDPLTICELLAGERLQLTTRTDDALGCLHLRLADPLTPLLIEQFDGDGALLDSATLAPQMLVELVVLEPGCMCATITPVDAAAKICDVRVYGVGTLPDDVPVWQPAEERVDFLIVTTHPDDEWLFLGAIYPFYGGERGLTGTFAYVTTPKNFGRLHEALNGLWTAGVRAYPHFLGFPDIHTSEPKEKKSQFREDEVLLSLVRLYRSVRPLVVFAQDPVRGEYGHWQHIISANAALEAARLAADASFDPASVQSDGTWQVRKVYCHLYEENAVVLDVETPLPAYDGMTALEIARAAYKEHKSQQDLWFYPIAKETSSCDIRRLGLAYTTVGLDSTAGADLFENIDPALFVASLNATPEPTASPAPTPKPTATPASATPTPTAEPAEPAGAAASPAAAIVAGGVLATCLLALLAQQRRARRAANRGTDEG